MATPRAKGARPLYSENMFRRESQKQETRNNEWSRVTPVSLGTRENVQLLPLREQRTRNYECIDAHAFSIRKTIRNTVYVVTL